MLPGDGAGGAGVVAADLAAGELVEQLLACVVQRLHLQHFAAKVAELGEPVAGVEREQGVDLLAQALGERGACAGGGDGDLQIAPADDGREVEVAEGRVVDGVDQDARGFGFGEDGAIDGGDVGRGDGEEVARRDRRWRTRAGARSISPASASSAMRGAGVRCDDGDAALAACSDSIFDSARLPAPMTMQGRPVSLRKIGKRDIARYSAGRVAARAYGCGVALDGRERRSGQCRRAARGGCRRRCGRSRRGGLRRARGGEIAAQQALDGFGAVVCGGAVADWRAMAGRTCRRLRRRRSRRRRPSCRPS